jgi:23S rRNA pseudouridine1911/1915/1917 synthase
MTVTAIDVVKKFAPGAKQPYVDAFTDPGGRPSVTHYETEHAYRAASLLSIRLETGRTHQIRVHMAAVRHPCCGDLLCGADPVLSKHLGLTRQWLHARALGFEHPSSVTGSA